MLDTSITPLKSHIVNGTPSVKSEFVMLTLAIRELSLISVVLTTGRTSKFPPMRSNDDRTWFDTLSDFFFAENDAHPKSKP